MQDWVVPLIYLIVFALIITSIIMSIISLSDSAISVEEQIATGDFTISDSNSNQTIDTLTVSGTLTSPEILQTGVTTSGSSSITSEIGDGLEEVGNLVMDETSEGTTAVRPDFFSQPNRVIVTNGWLRAKVTNLGVFEDSKEITISSSSKPLYTYVDRFFVQGIELISSGGDKGQVGAKGDKGVDGDQGDQGPVGDDGTKGATGDKGDKGSKGEQGLNGLNGATGLPGDIGETGIDGDKGSKGSPIIISNLYDTQVDLDNETVFPPDGNYAIVVADGTLWRSDGSAYTFATDLDVVGADGEKGQPGDSGVKGAKGEKGELGFAGPQGEMGPKGEVGSSATKGEQGDKGAQGTKGAKGSTGAQGDQGLKGTQGEIDGNLFTSSARMTLEITELDGESLLVHIDSDIWTYENLPIWYKTQADLVEPVWTDIVFEGTLAEIPVNDVTTPVGITLSPLFGPLFIAWHDGVEQKVLGPFLNGTPNTINFPAQLDAPFVLNQINAISPEATSTSGLPILYSSQTPTVCSIVSGSSYQMLSTGTCTILAEDNGNEVYNAAIPVEQSFDLT